MSSTLNKNNLFLQNNDLEKITNNWLHLLSINMSENTFICYKKDFMCFINFFFNKNNNKPLSFSFIKNITISEIRKWIVFLQNKKISPKSRSRYISSVKNFFEYCYTNKLIENNIMKYISLPKIGFSIPKDIEEQSIEKILLYLEQYKDEEWIVKRNCAIVLLMYGCGLRISETINIKLSDLMLENMTIRVLGKRKKERIVPMLQIVVKKINEYMKICPHIDIQNPDSLLFWSNTGKKLQRTYFANFIQKIRNELNLPYYITPHAFRHSCASHLLNHGTDIKIVQDLLGHSSLSSTQIYTNIHYKYKITEYTKKHPLAKN